MNWHDIQFQNPELLYLLIFVPLFFAYYFLKERRMNPSFTFSGDSGFAGIKASFKLRMRHLPFITRVLAFSLLVVAIARPQTASQKSQVNSEGIDIIMALDVSTSMLSEDFKPNRIEAAKKYAMDFIDKRINDRIGLVIFSGESFTQCPLTIDHDVLKNLFKSIESGMIEDGTAIGEGLATAVSRLKDSKSKSRVIILLTDGVNNMGAISPQTAAEIAKSFGIRVYTIGCGTRGVAPYPFKTPYGIQYRNIEVQIDEDLLKQIASSTGGRYFRATNNKSLESIYNEIDKLEKIKIEDMIFKKHEEFFPFALAAALLFLFEIFIRYTWLKLIP